MRVTPSTPSPRGSLSTAGHFSSQAQTPIQGRAQQGPQGGGGRDPGVVLLLQTKSSPKGRSLRRPALQGRQCAHGLRTCLLLSGSILGSALPSLPLATVYHHPPRAITVPVPRDQHEWTDSPCPQGGSPSPMENGHRSHREPIKVGQDLPKEPETDPWVLRTPCPPSPSAHLHLLKVRW